jgi:hypothetical protein
MYRFEHHVTKVVVQKEGELWRGALFSFCVCVPFCVLFYDFMSNVVAEVSDFHFHEYSKPQRTILR